MFEIGASYAREQLLEFAGSKQQQSGIIWGDSSPECVIVTSGGRAAKSAGYADRQRSDGSWEYHGQGTQGDQDPARFSNRLLVDGQRTVLLFTTREPTASEVREISSYAKRYLFEGCFGVAGWDTYYPTTGSRNGDQLLRFLLVPCMAEDDQNKLATSDDELAIASLEELRASIDDSFGLPQRSRLSTREYRARSALIKRYVFLRAHGRCEYCGVLAPFERENGESYLETHHILRLADDGPDHPQNVIALCPNCHREAHYGQKRLAIRKRCLEIAGVKENSRTCVTECVRSANRIFVLAA